MKQRKIKKLKTRTDLYGELQILPETLPQCWIRSMKNRCRYRALRYQRAWLKQIWLQSGQKGVVRKTCDQASTRTCYTCSRKARASRGPHVFASWRSSSVVSCSTDTQEFSVSPYRYRITLELITRCILIIASLRVGSHRRRERCNVAFHQES